MINFFLYCSYLSNKLLYKIEYRFSLTTKFSDTFVKLNIKNIFLQQFFHFSNIKRVLKSQTLFRNHKFAVSVSRAAVASLFNLKSLVREQVQKLARRFFIKDIFIKIRRYLLRNKNILQTRNLLAKNILLDRDPIPVSIKFGHCSFEVAAAEWLVLWTFDM